MSQERPFISKSTDDLEIISKASKNNLELLKLIESELKFRDTKKAQVLLTNISLLIKNLESTKLDDIFRYEQGILRHCGYKVGLNGLGENQRRQILDRIFLYPLPPINDDRYIKDWGEPATEVRLKKLLDSITAFIRNAKRRNKENYNEAIQDWEADLNYLKTVYGSKTLVTPIEVELNKLKKDYQKLEHLYNTEQQRTKLQQEAAIQAQLELKTYQVEVDKLQERVTQMYQTYLNEQKSYQQALSFYNDEKTKATQLVVQRDEWKQSALINQEAASQLVLVRQDIQTYQVEINDLKASVAQYYQSYRDEQKNYRQALQNYNNAQAKATELIAQRNEWQQRALTNQEAASQLTQVQQDIQAYQVKVDELKEQVTHNYQIYLDEQKNYQEALARYNEEKARANELLAKCEEVSSERDNYLTLYNESQTQLKFERRSKASIKGWETRRKTENEKLKREIGEMVVLLRDSLASKDEAINNLYVVAERMDRIQSLVDSVEEDTTSNPVGLVQKFKRIWLAVKEILSE